jgi:hypothetical protein
MNLFKRLFGKTEKTSKKHTTQGAERSKFMPEVKLPVDEMFMKNFTANGGKFIYCENSNELFDNFNLILEENEWKTAQLTGFNESLLQLFKVNANQLNNSDAQAFILDCEYLIGSTGAILISSNQIGEKRLAELPETFIVYAKTSQLIELIGDGLQLIKKKHQKIPNNITTIKKFDIDKEDDFMTYGSPSKNLYLLLVEDL